MTIYKNNGRVHGVFCESVLVSTTQKFIPYICILYILFVNIHCLLFTVFWREVSCYGIVCLSVRKAKCAGHNF